MDAKITKTIEISAVIRRADGTVEDLGVISKNDQIEQREIEEE